MLGEDGPCHEATASVSAMATATMRIARASQVLSSLGSRQQCCDGTLCTSLAEALPRRRSQERSLAETDTGSCQRPCWRRDEGGWDEKPCRPQEKGAERRGR